MGWYQYCRRSHGIQADAQARRAGAQAIVRATIDQAKAKATNQAVATVDEGRGVCGLEGCSEPCHELPSPEVGWYSYCRRSHGVAAKADAQAREAKEKPAVARLMTEGLPGIEGALSPKSEREDHGKNYWALPRCL